MTWRKQRITQAMRASIAERFGCRAGHTIEITCAYCPATIVIDRTRPGRTRFLDDQGRSFPEIDHVEPLSQGGAHEVENLVPACLSCNRSKGAR